MIELNLLEKKQPLVLPTVLGIDLNNLNLKMLGVAFVIYYMPGIVGSYMFDDKIAETQVTVDQLAEQNGKLTKSIQKDADIKNQVDAYKNQVERLKKEIYSG